MLTSPSTLPLSDLRVLDLSPLLPGPYCGQILANLGAEVIRVEPPAGDWTRAVPNDAFAVANRGKRSLALDLKNPDAQRALKRVADGVDVVLEGFRPGVAARLGADYATLSRDNPRLVYCSISGFGQQGPDNQRPGHDIVYLAAAGALDYPGSWGGRPARSGVPVSDLAAADYAAIAILAALRRRDSLGAGCHLDVSITDVAFSLAAVRAGSQLQIKGDEDLHLFPTNDLFETGDGVILAIAAVEEKFWLGLREVLSGRNEAIADPKFGDEEGRRRHGDELHALVADIIASEPASTWLSELPAADVPVEPVRTVAEAAAEAERRGRPLTLAADGEQQVPFPVRCDGEAMARSGAAPALGADNDAILAAAGLSEDEIAGLRPTAAEPGR